MEIKEFQISQIMKKEISSVVTKMSKEGIQQMNLKKPFSGFIVSFVEIKDLKLFKVFKGKEFPMKTEKVFLFHS